MTETSVHIVGIGGRNRSGKDTLAELFMEAGYYGVSFGDITRDFARERHADKPDPISVANMTETSNWLRNMHGPAAILDIALERYAEAVKEGGQYVGLVLFSIRAPVEVDFIIEHGGDMVWVQTSDETRYERSLLAKREGEPEISFEQMLKQEQLQERAQPGLPAEVQMNIPYVQEHATIILENEGSDREAFLEEAKNLIQTVTKKTA